MDYNTLFDTFNIEKKNEILDCCDDTDNYSLHNFIIILLIFVLYISSK